MKKLLSSRGLFVLAFVMLIAANIVVLMAVASNRAGTPHTQIALTERELQLPYWVQRENSGLSLRLAWRALPRAGVYNNYINVKYATWFDAEKLEELGFNMDSYLRSKDDASFYKQPIPKEVFVVLENGGEPYREAVRRTEIALEKEKKLFDLDSGDKRLRDNFERAEKRLKLERISTSRLFAIDAGLDSEELREKYPDRTRFLITKGLVKPGYSYNGKKKEVYGYISKLSVENIHVSLKHRKMFDAILARDESKRTEIRPPRYKVELAFGSRFEPWIVSVQNMEDNAD